MARGSGGLTAAKAESGIAMGAAPLLLHASGSCTNSVLIFRMLVFRMGVRLREPFLSTSHAGSRPPGTFTFARITSIVTAFADSVHTGQMHKRSMHEFRVDFLKCPFPE
jgi:hypothetical protein